MSEMLNPYLSLLLWEHNVVYHTAHYCVKCLAHHVEFECLQHCVETLMKRDVMFVELLDHVV